MPITEKLNFHTIAILAVIGILIATLSLKVAVSIFRLFHGEPDRSSDLESETNQSQSWIDSFPPTIAASLVITLSTSIGTAFLSYWVLAFTASFAGAEKLKNFPSLMVLLSLVLIFIVVESSFLVSLIKLKVSESIIISFWHLASMIAIMFFVILLGGGLISSLA
ncbi:MAG: hypothetical protein KDA65_06015 [Planctomycetaceae bacterium]|nr:hypothetical protein [Planctomycetaceae bacterium]